jgi:hypothetical protein
MCPEGLFKSFVVGINGMCGGIDPYTLMATHGPHRRRWPNSSEQATQITQLVSVPRGIDRDQLDDQGNLVG